MNAVCLCRTSLVMLAGPLLACAARADVALTAPTYRSAFEHYQAHREVDRQPWPDANARVQAIGGWRAYAREAATPDASAAPGAHGAHGAHAPAGGAK